MATLKRGTCSGCGDQASTRNPYICARCNSERSIAFRRRLRSECFALLGGVCAECGFDDQRAFQIDHLAGGGSKHRLALKNSPTRLYRYVLDNPAEFQLLCANCNQIKRIEVDQLRKVS